jgi:hypothetical protein
MADVMISVLIGIAAASVTAVLSASMHAPHVWPGAVVTFVLATANQFTVSRWVRRP